MCACTARLAGQVSSVELREGGVDVVRIEFEARHDALVGVNLNDAERLGRIRPGPLISEQPVLTSEREALPAGRNDVWCDCREPRGGCRLHACRSWRLDRVVPPRSRPAGDRR